MKVKLFLAAMLLMVGANVMADEYQYLTITYSDTERSIYLPIIQKISFADDYVVVTTTEGVHKYPISLLDKITFTENATAIKDLPEQAKDLTFKDGTLAVKGNGLLRIYGANGALISIANVKEGANINLGNFPAGVYIVRMGDKTIKVRK